jgi:hypothetical protein
MLGLVRGMSVATRCSATQRSCSLLRASNCPIVAVDCNEAVPRPVPYKNYFPLLMLPRKQMALLPRRHILGGREYSFSASDRRRSDAIQSPFDAAPGR